MAAIRPGGILPRGFQPVEEDRPIPGWVRPKFNDLTSPDHIVQRARIGLARSVARVKHRLGWL